MNDLRQFLYFFAKLLGDVSSVQNNTVGKRVGRRIVGRMAGKAIGKIFK